MRRYMKVGILLTALLAVIVSAMTIDGVRWRVGVAVMKANGDLPEISWGELAEWAGPGSPVYLDRLLLDPDPRSALRNTRYDTADDARAGEELFVQHCSACHGVNGEGTNAPALNQMVTNTDWDLYRAIRYGIAGTAMPAHKLSNPGIWQVMTYLKTLATPGRVTSLPFEGVSTDHATTSPAAGKDWVTYSGGYEGWRYSSLDKVNRDTVSRLRLTWMRQSQSNYNKFESNPLVADGIMFVTEPPGTVLALDAVTGATLWRFDREPPKVTLCCGVVNRGVALLGDKVLVATIDAHLLALDARTGQMVWQAEVADHKLGYSITSAPLAFNGMVVTGVAGGESGIRGFLSAYDVASGTLVWRFDTIPAPGSTGSESWRDETWSRGGGATWMTGSYDPASDVLYWGTGHSVHEPFDPGISDKLFGSSIIALAAGSGDLLWYYQATPNDIHGYDSNQIPVLVDVDLGNGPVPALANANRNGFYYLIDRSSGKLLVGKEFARQTWAKKLDDRGRPLTNKDARPTKQGQLVWPGATGATNWWPPAFDPTNKALFVPVVENASIFYVRQVDYVPGEFYAPVVGRQPINQTPRHFLRSINVSTGEMLWEHEFPSRESASSMKAAMASAGGLVFVGDHENFYALDSRNGAELWKIGTGGEVLGSPITYQVNGVQYIAIYSGRALMIFSLAEPS